VPQSLAGTSRLDLVTESELNQTLNNEEERAVKMKLKTVIPSTRDAAPKGTAGEQVRKNT